VWQELRTELNPRGLEIVSVSLDVDPEPARAFLATVAHDYPALVDSAHLVGELFGVVNVPYSVWIDEGGKIVRPAEPANVLPPALGRIDSGEIPLPKPPSEYREQMRQIRYEPDMYVGGLRDWVEKGPASEWAHTPDEVVRRSDPRSEERARAAAHFELGQALHQRGEVEAGQEHWRRAHRLYPENWTYKRAAWYLLGPAGAQPEATVYESNWLDDIRALGPENFYPPLRP
jgi:tetratricopeptide (TPR) repeat protein